MFITPAFAQGAAPGGGDFFLQLVPMVANLKRGDTIVTSGGIIGKVTRVKDDAEIEVEIAEDTRIRLIRGTVAEVRAKGEPVKEGT